MSHLRKYPNVKARLRLLRKAPALPARESYMDIWLRGSRFRVRDEAGRSVGEMLDDLSSPHGLGAIAASMEAIMDVWSQSQAAPHETTELYGNHATGKGLVYRREQDPWPINARELAPIAEQILAGAAHRQLAPDGLETRLGRRAKVYRSVLTGEIRRARFKSEVTQVISPPYLLFSHVCAAQNSEHYYTRELVSLEEKIVTVQDLTPPDKL